MASFLSELHRLNSSELMHLFTVNLPYNDLQRSSLDATKACCTSDITLLYASLDECKRLHSKLQMELQAAKLDVDSIKAVTHPCPSDAPPSCFKRYSSMEERIESIHVSLL